MPLPRNSKGGRPPFKPTPTQRQRVAIAAGAGMSHEEIALGLGISRPTLEKHFEAELSTGAHARRLEVIAAMHAAAKKGNVAAAKTYLAMTPKVAAPPLSEGDEKPVPVAAPMGKKEAANAAAVTAQVGTEWSELLPAGALPQ